MMTMLTISMLTRGECGDDGGFIKDLFAFSRSHEEVGAGAFRG